MSEPARIAISGLGVVSSHGAELQDQREAFLKGSCKIREVDRSAGYHRDSGSRWAALVDPACYRSVLPPLKARRMSPPSRFAMVAAKMALLDAGLAEDALASSHGENVTAVVFGTSFGPSSYSERILRQVFLESPQAASPMLFTESVANAPAAQVALALGCKGPNVTLTQREASALLAVAEGAALIRSGQARRALVGGVEELNPLLHSILDRFGALSGSRRALTDSAQGEQARPLDLRRRGFVAAEGAAVLVLESLDDLEARSGRVRALVNGAARAFDPRAPVTGWSRDAPVTAARLRSEWCRLCGRDPESGVEAVVLGASGSASHDLLEASLVRPMVSVDPNTAVTTPKVCFGEQGMATLVGALLGIEGVRPAIDPTFRRDPDVGLAPRLHSHHEEASGANFLLSAAASGGSCCWLGLESP